MMLPIVLDFVHTLSVFPITPCHPCPTPYPFLPFCLLVLPLLPLCLLVLPLLPLTVPHLSNLPFLPPPFPPPSNALQSAIQRMKSAQRTPFDAETVGIASSTRREQREVHAHARTHTHTHMHRHMHTHTHTHTTHTYTQPLHTTQNSPNYHTLMYTHVAHKCTHTCAPHT